MAQRLVKIILPESYGKSAQALLVEQGSINFWQEESADGHAVISALTDSSGSEQIMDLFERKYASLPGFRIVLLPVEASIPRLDEPDDKSSDTSPDQAKPKKLPSRISREELYSDVADSARLTRIFVWMTVLSTIVVAIGLLKNNVAVIIGAMVIAPFLGPNVALALSTNLADEKLGLNALKTIFSGIFLVLLLSTGMGFIFKADPSIHEIAMRTRPGFSDIVLALASGCAGVLAFTSGASSAVIGVMVAVALLPPLTVCGLLLGTGHFSGAAGALLLFITNIICINLAGGLTFLAQGVSPRSWWEADKAKKATRKALFRWSVMLVILAVIIFLWQWRGAGL